MIHRVALLHVFVSFYVTDPEFQREPPVGEGVGGGHRADKCLEVTAFSKQARAETYYINIPVLKIQIKYLFLKAELS